MINKIKKLSKLTIECIGNDFIFRETNNGKNYCSLGKEYYNIDCNCFKRISEKESVCEYE